MLNVTLSARKKERKKKESLIPIMLNYSFELREGGVYSTEILITPCFIKHAFVYKVDKYTVHPIHIQY